MIADYHIHTHFSTDSEVNPIDHINKAISLGMQELCFTDHIDFDYPLENGNKIFIFDADNYFETLLALKEQFQSKINIKIGVELGLNPNIYKQNTDFIHKYDFDFVIGSSHIVNGIDPYYKEYWDGLDSVQGIMKYYNAILDNVKLYESYNVYGHLDYIRRYVPDKHYIYNDSLFFDITDEILRKIIETGHGIELNTRGLSSGLTDFIPTISLIKRYKALGGEIITLGSDAHFVKALGYGFKTSRDILLDSGFKYHTLFTKGKPEFLPL